MTEQTPHNRPRRSQITIAAVLTALALLLAAFAGLGSAGTADASPRRTQTPQSSPTAGQTFSLHPPHRNTSVTCQPGQPIL